ncbi:MAG: DNA-directed RNA polymerase subunit alpha [Fimbriimonadaceae bacterium]|jgi:DNA-directed RNA polymerase subunit alpha|nr:DNA-directed RNA polymerase subunit alpha [Fimbriimonadaceae bacterium]
MPQISTLDLNNEYAKFVLEPLERGYGHTIGNALRRVLLSSVPGAAVNAVRIDKVFHEFAVIPGCKEDTTEFLLNIKDLAIRINPDLPAQDETILKLNVKGPGRVTGADIECPPGVEIMNPELYLITVSDPKGTLGVEFYVGTGSGYMLPDKQERYRGMIGIIPTGAQYTPVRKANYIVEQTRVGQRTDYERLVLEVTTNGAVPPNDALTQAAHILDKYFRMFFELGRSGAPEFFGSTEELPSELSHVPEIKIEELDFSQRTFNCLRRAGILNLRQLAAVNEGDLTGIRGFGRKSLNEVRDKLGEHDIELKPAKGGYINLDALDDEDY